MNPKPYTQTRWGNAHEQVACDEYVLARNARNQAGGINITVAHSGLNIHSEMRTLTEP